VAHSSGISEFRNFQHLPDLRTGDESRTIRFADNSRAKAFIYIRFATLACAVSSLSFYRSACRPVGEQDREEEKK